MKLSYINYSEDDLLTFANRWSWIELRFGWINNFITINGLIKYANKAVIVETVGVDFIVEIIIATDEDDVAYYLDRLCELEKDQDEDFLKEKWLYAFLSYYFYNRHKYYDCLSIVELLYADFDYPDEISKFVRYMPISTSIDFVEGYKYESLFIEWEKYINVKNEKFNSDRLLN